MGKAELTSDQGLDHHIFFNPFSVDFMEYYAHFFYKGFPNSAHSFFQGSVGTHCCQESVLCVSDSA